MLKTSIFLLLAFLSCVIRAKEPPPLYQIDLIIFTHQPSSANPVTLSLNSTLSSDNFQAIPLRTVSHKDFIPYHLLPSSSSQLQQEYRALHRKPQYRVLLHYSWLQPYNNQQAIQLPKVIQEGWELEGRLRIRRSNYYLLNAELLFSPLTGHQTPFTVSQNQRIKGGSVYYFDHPQVGMLIKVHQLIS
ncbi:CsiV family protein [Legionella fairfieldensis]|uniref:CsiV family protein n=1 Tax=Legionella fairfieldensis TaxID=45064 RepID=UPI00048B3CCF|nr:CsiV family protein [Legionella fairfieldensis]